MLPAPVAAASEITPLPAGPSAEQQVILWVYLGAACLFIVFWMVRFAMGRVRFHEGAAPREGSSPATAGQLPPPLPGPEAGSHYAPPETLQTGESGPQGLTWHFKVPVWPYRLYDLPLIGLVFLIFCGLATGGGGGEPDIPLEAKYKPEVLIASMVFQLILMGMVCAFTIRRIKQAEWLGLRWNQWWLAIVIAPVTVLFMWFVLFATFFTGWNSWLQETLGIEGMQESVKLLQEAKDPAVVILMTMAAVIVAPLAEEVVFRGYLYPAAKRFCGPAGAMLFSSLVFAAAHGNAVALFPLFILAVLLCLIYEFTGSIWATISVHFLFNAATVGLQLLARSGIIDMPDPT